MSFRCSGGGNTRVAALVTAPLGDITRRITGIQSHFHTRDNHCRDNCLTGVTVIKPWSQIYTDITNMRDMIHVKSPCHVFAHDSDTCELNFAILNTSVSFLDHFTISSLLKNMPTDLAGLSFSQFVCRHRLGAAAVLYWGRDSPRGAGRGAATCADSHGTAGPACWGGGCLARGGAQRRAAEPFNR